MQVLLDYDNIPDPIRRNGARYIADKVCLALQLVAMTELLRDRRLDLRLYGGWYTGNNLSAAGQRLSADVQNAFPFVLKSDPKNPNTAITVAANLAHSLVVLPKHTLYSTFRTRPGLEKVVCVHPSTLGCHVSNCPLQVVFDFFSTDRCPYVGCQITSGHLIRRRGEQKLVDTMMVADLMHLSHSGESAVAVVTADDDIWPGVISGMQLGARIIHIWTKHHNRHPQYLNGVPGKYSRVAL